MRTVELFENTQHITIHYHKNHQNPIHVMFVAVQSLLTCALFTGKLSYVIRDRRRVLIVNSARVRVPSRGLILSLVSRVSVSLSLSLSVAQLHWRVLYTWCHDGSELLHSSSFHSCGLDLYIVSEIWKYCFYRQHHNYLYTCLYSRKRMYARDSSSS